MSKIVPYSILFFC